MNEMNRWMGIQTGCKKIPLAHVTTPTWCTRRCDVFCDEAEYNLRECD